MNTTDHNTDAEHPRSPLPMVSIKLRAARVADRPSIASDEQSNKPSAAVTPCSDTARASVAIDRSLFWQREEFFYIWKCNKPASANNQSRGNP